jgi:hypothetical protein
MEKIEFLRARLDDLERIAKEADEIGPVYGWGDNAYSETIEVALSEGCSDETLDHMAAWKPPFVLGLLPLLDDLVKTAESDAQSIVRVGDRMSAQRLIDRLLALFVEHPDFPEEWKA